MPTTRTTVVRAERHNGVPAPGRAEYDPKTTLHLTLEYYKGTGRCEIRNFCRTLRRRDRSSNILRDLTRQVAGATSHRTL